jgi:hypothetical protein
MKAISLEDVVLILQYGNLNLSIILAIVFAFQPEIVILGCALKRNSSQTPS